MDFAHFKFGADEFRDAERMHVVEEVASHQAVAAALVDVEPCTAGDDKPHAVFVEVEESLEKRLPADELVNLVKRDDGLAVGGDSKPCGVGEPCRIASDKTPRCEVVPREVTVGKRFSQCRLSALARACEKCHLSIVTKVFVKHSFVYSLPLGDVFHGAKYIKNGFHRQYRSGIYAGMVITKLFKTIEWSIAVRLAAGDCALFLCRDRNRGRREAAK